MKKTLQLILLVTTVLGLAARAGASDRWETLRAINWVENPTNRTTYGSCGELGPYQFRRDTWKLHTQKPFKLANDRATADEVAVQHYEWIKRGLQDAGIAPTTHNIAMAWNCGLGAVINGRVPSVSYQYANRVTSLVDSFKRQGVREQVAQATAAIEAPVAAPVVTPKFTLEGHIVQLVVAGRGPVFTLNANLDEPEILTVVKTDALTQPEPTSLFVVSTRVPEPEPEAKPASRFVIATLD